MSSYGLTPFDELVLTDIKFVLNNPQGKIDFQFVPHITQESNSSIWESSETMLAVEPLRIFKGADGRKVSMEWEYLATDDKWTCTKIAENLKKLKSYFFEFVPGVYPVAKVTYTRVIPVETCFRLLDVNVQYSHEIVNNNGLHPLHSKVNVSLQLATNVNEPFQKDGKVEVPPLGPATFDWY
jgi:hypothetical protein